MLKKIINFIKNLFKKEEEYTMPYESYLIQYNEDAGGETGDEFKEIIIIEGNKSRTYPYSENLINALIKIKKMPGWDNTKNIRELPVYTKVEPGIIEYPEE